MANLTIKNLPDPLYRKLQERAKQNQRSVPQEVAQILAEALESDPLSILELRGLGKNEWAGIDPTRHVGTERRSWE